MDLDYYVSFGPLLLYANDKQTLISKAERDRILIETDGPVRFSGCFGMKTAQIVFLQSIIFCASKILSLKYNEMEEILEKNSLRYLGI
jgi:TatD DNase family protein